MKVSARYVLRNFMGKGSNSKQFMNFAKMSIYIKDKDLDKARYKHSKMDELNNYLKNYKQDDPKPLSEEDIKKLYVEAEKEMKEEQLKAKSQTSEQPANDQDNKNPKLLDPTKLKDVFDKMVEIDSDPKSKKAQDYYKKLEEMERKNPNKKRSEVIIKTMRKGRTVSNEKFTSTIGQGLTEEEKAFERKFIDYKSVQFPEINPINFTVKSQGKEVKIANYRYPSQTLDKKGIIYYVHGYGDYCQRYAYLGKQFAEAGYDFVGMDQKGFGNSEGKRAYIDSEELLIEEHCKYFDLVDQRYGGKNVPKFQLGISMGGLISLKLSLAKQGWFKGMGLVAPYIELKDPETFKKYQGIANIMDKIYPSFKINKKVGPKRHIPAKYEAYAKDSLLEIDNIPVHNILVNQQASKKFKDQEMDQIKTPFIMILAGQDHHVSNKAAKEFFEIAPIEDKDIITYDDASHNIIMDGEYTPMVVKDLIGWFNTHS